MGYYVRICDDSSVLPKVSFDEMSDESYCSLDSESTYNNRDIKFYNVSKRRNSIYVLNWRYKVVINKSYNRYKSFRRFSTDIRSIKQKDTSKCITDIDSLLNNSLDSAEVSIYNPHITFKKYTRNGKYVKS